MNIQLETLADYREVENLTREAFWNVYRPGCTEHYVLNQYRSNPDFIPELDFVMEKECRLIGHVMFSKAELVLPDGTCKPFWTFGPISSRFIDNSASGRVMEKCGFIPTGETCIDESLAGSDKPMRVLRLEIKR
ncbi:MAG: hypothetical protein K6A64_01275 [Bacteroidales bacterium]|nr:hypothetical protein [Bacteroidales bacterium]